MLPRVTAPRVLGLHHLAIKARDVPALAAFYAETLGLATRAEHRDERGVRSIWLEAGPAILMIERAGEPAPPDGAAPRERLDRDPPGLHLVALSVGAADRGSWRARLEAAGCAVLRESDFTLYALDPEGNRLGLSSWPEPGR
jgi:glyoxylase I family protein